MESSSGGHNLPKIQVFRPTMDEFKNFPSFIEFIELQGAHKAGLAKVIPPKEWVARKSGYDDMNLKIPAPILQSVSGNKGLYQQYNIQQKPMLLKDFAKLANDENHRPPSCRGDLDELERKFWKNITFNPPIYGADISGSLYDKDQKIWNINRLGSILDRVNEEYQVTIEGVNTAYLYFGMWKTSFCWHTEDMDLYSINYLHYGAPKAWYAVPPEHGRRLERLAAGFFPNEAKRCPSFLRHKMTHISPHVLRRYSIPFNKITQEAGEFMITFPYSYHAGYNHGYNCAESTNFASIRWIEYGKRSLQCVCNSDMVHISMDCFIKNYQPERYDLWKAGLDAGPHPEDDQSKLYSSSSGIKTVTLPDAQNKMAVALLGSQLPENSRNHKVSRRHPVISQLLPEESVCKTDEVAQSEMMVNAEHHSDPTAKTEICEAVVDQKTNAAENWESANLDVKQRKRKQSPVELEGKRASKQKKKPVISSVGCCTLSSSAYEEAGQRVKDGNSEVLLDKEVVCKDLLQTVVPSSGCNYEHTELEHNFVSVSVPGTFRIGNHTASLDSSLNAKVFKNSTKTTVKSENLVSVANNSTMPEISLSAHSENPVCLNESQCMELGLPFSFSQVLQPVESSGIVTNQLPGNFGNILASFDVGSPSSDSFGDNLLLVNDDVLQEEDIVDVINDGNVRDFYQPMEGGLNDIESKLLNHRESYDKRRPQRKLEKSKHSGPGNSGRQKNNSSAAKHSLAVADVEKTSPHVASMAGLFQFLPEDESTEVEFNKRCSLVEPYCQICSLFTGVSMKASNSSSWNFSAGNAAKRPACSQPIIPEVLFSCSSTKDLLKFRGKSDLIRELPQKQKSIISNTDPTNTFSSQSLLIVCSRCQVCVHASCYGELNISPERANSWTCDRCLGGTFRDACCLCLLRGGALKRTTTGRWSHIICALVIREASFDDVLRRQPISTEGITSTRRKLKCVYCAPPASISQTHLGGACVQCTNARCTTSFHVTCAQAAGVKFELSLEIEPKPLAVICVKHANQKLKEMNTNLSQLSISVGDHVVAKHRNRRYYRCLVTNILSQVFFKVAFEDGSFSNDTFPEDIEIPTCSASDPPPSGSNVKVRWSDGLLYDAVFKGVNPVCLYQVQFEDGSVLSLDRKDIWSEKEELPKKVASRLSVATETKHNLFQEDFHKSGNSRTRSVQLCYIRDQDFINP